MGTPLAPAKIVVGDRIKDLWLVKKKLGEGSCGIVFLVQSLKNNGAEGRAAMKVEPFMKNKDDEILKMEMFVLRKLQKSRHACRLLMAGREKNYSYLIMSLLGKELSELRRRYPDKKMPLSTTLRVGLQSLQAIHDLHSIGFIHRDVKPTNFACGFLNKNILYIFDFGLARQIFTNDRGKLRLRDPREKVLFRGRFLVLTAKLISSGTVRYCSINVHQYKEQGRHDDLWSWFYMLIELITSTLPWKGMTRRDSGYIKETITDKQLCVGCSSSFTEINTILKRLTYASDPPYEKLRDLIDRDLAAIKIKSNDPFDWDTTQVKKKATVDDDPLHKKEKDRDEKVEIDKMEDSNTCQDAPDESVESAMSDEESETRGFAKEDTLETVADVINNLK